MIKLPFKIRFADIESRNRALDILYKNGCSWKDQEALKDYSKTTSLLDLDALIVGENGIIIGTSGHSAHFMSYKYPEITTEQLLNSDIEKEPNKISITDKMIRDIHCYTCLRTGITNDYCNNTCFKEVKEELKSKGYAVEEEKSVFEFPEYLKSYNDYKDSLSTMNMDALFFGQLYNKQTYIFLKLKYIADKLNEGWEPDWNNKNELKYFIEYDHVFNKSAGIFSATRFERIAASYFKTSDLAKKAKELIKGDIL